MRRRQGALDRFDACARRFVKAQSRRLAARHHRVTRRHATRAGVARHRRRRRRRHAATRRAIKRFARGALALTVDNVANLVAHAQLRVRAEQTLTSLIQQIAHAQRVIRALMRENIIYF